MKTATRNKRSRATNDHDVEPLADENFPPPDHPIAIAMARALCETLALPRICLSRQCRRMNACKGDAQACLAVGETMLAPDVVEGAKNFLAGQIEGLSFDQVNASGVEQMEAYAQWIGRIAPTLPALKRRLGAR